MIAATNIAGCRKRFKKHVAMPGSVSRHRTRGAVFVNSWVIIRPRVGPSDQLGSRRQNAMFAGQRGRDAFAQSPSRLRCRKQNRLHSGVNEGVTSQGDPDLCGGHPARSRADRPRPAPGSGILDIRREDRSIPADADGSRRGKGRKNRVGTPGRTRKAWTVQGIVTTTSDRQRAGAAPPIQQAIVWAGG